MSDLPVFKYHPDPLRSGSVVESRNKCRSCRKVRGYIYTGPVYAEKDLDEAICPWCIADGSAYRKFDAAFVDDQALPGDVSPAVADEIAHRTPGFSAWQTEQWLSCCGQPSAFIEPVGAKDIRERYPTLEGTLMIYIVHELGISGGAARRLLDSLDRDQGPTAYVFQCLSCETLRSFIDGIYDVAGE